MKLFDCAINNIFYIHRAKFYQKYSEADGKGKSRGYKFSDSENQLWPTSRWQDSPEFFPIGFISSHSESPAKDWEEYPRFRGHSCDSEPLNRGYEFFFWGYVHKVKLQHSGGVWFVQSQCWASQHKSTRYEQKLTLINKDSQLVNFASCVPCPAGTN